MEDTHLSYEQVLQSAAFHEAAHAVMVVLLGYQVSCASIIPDEKHRGNVSHSCPPGTEAHIIVSQAGAVCLGLYKIQSDEDGGALEDAKDSRNDVAQLVPDDDREPLDELDRRRDYILRRLSKQAEKFLQEPDVKAALEALAAKLLEIKCVPGADVHRILEPLLGSAKQRAARYLHRQSAISS